MSKKEKSTPTVRPARGERKLQVKKEQPGQKSKIVQFDDIDKIQFKVLSASKQKSNKKDEKGKQKEYLEIKLQGKMPDETMRDYRSIVFYLPDEMVSPVGVMVGNNYSIGIALNIKDEVHAGYKAKFMGFRERIIDALIPRFHEIAPFMKFDMNVESEDEMRQLISGKLNKIVKPPEDKPASDTQYMNMGCRFSTFMFAEVYNGNYTGTVKKVERDTLIDMKVTHTTKCRFDTMRCISSAMGIGFEATEVMVDKIEPCSQEVEVADLIAKKMASNVVNDVNDQIEQVKRMNKATNSNDDALINSMVVNGSLGEEGEEGEGTGNNGDEIDDEDLDNPMG